MERPEIKSFVDRRQARSLEPTMRMSKLGYYGTVVHFAHVVSVTASGACNRRVAESAIGASEAAAGEAYRPTVKEP